MDEIKELNPEKKFISWQTLFLMDLCTVIGIDDIMYNFQNQGMSVIFSWVVMVLFYVIPYSLMVGQLGSVFNKEGGGLSSWVRGTDGEFLGYFTAWTYWAASIPYAVDSANEIIVDLGWALTGSEKFQSKISNSTFAILTFLMFIIFIIVEHHFSRSMEPFVNNWWRLDGCHDYFAGIACFCRFGKIRWSHGNSAIYLEDDAA